GLQDRPPGPARPPAPPRIAHATPQCDDRATHSRGSSPRERNRWRAARRRARVPRRPPSRCYTVRVAGRLASEPVPVKRHPHVEDDPRILPVLLARRGGAAGRAAEALDVVEVARGVAAAASRAYRPLAAAHRAASVVGGERERP